MSTTAQSNHKTSDKNVAKQSAEALFTAQGSATTLEVKDAMRAAGYWAEQKQVSDWMTTLADELGWGVSHGTQFKTYTQANTNSAVPSSNSNSTSSTSLAQLFTTLFGIHKFAINTNSKLGSDLNIMDTLDIQSLTSEIKKEFGVDVTITSDNTFGEIESMIDSKKKINPVTSTAIKVKRSGRARVNLQPISIITGKTPADKDFKQHLSTLGLDQNDWVLSIGTKYNKSVSCMVYPGSESRDHVRTAYARNVGNRIQMTRACRVKNIR